MKSHLPPFRVFPMCVSKCYYYLRSKFFLMKICRNFAILLRKCKNISNCWMEAYRNTPTPSNSPTGSLRAKTQCVPYQKARRPHAKRARAERNSERHGRRHRQRHSADQNNSDDHLTTRRPCYAARRRSASCDHCRNSDDLLFERVFFSRFGTSSILKVILFLRFLSFSLRALY